MDKILQFIFSTLILLLSTLEYKSSDPTCAEVLCQET